MEYNILNFSHPLTDEQIAQINEIVGGNGHVYKVKFHLNMEAPMGEQTAKYVSEMAASVGVMLYHRPNVVILPSIGAAGALVIQILAGMLGGAPPVARLIARSTNPYITEYVVAEVIEMEGWKRNGRKRRPE